MLATSARYHSHHPLNSAPELLQFNKGKIERRFFLKDNVMRLQFYLLQVE